MTEDYDNYYSLYILGSILYYSLQAFSNAL